MTLWKNLVVALVAAFALAACSSSDNGSGTDMTEMPDPAMACTDAGGEWNAGDMTCTSAEELAAARAEMQRSAINSAITAADTAVAGLTDDASDAAIGSAEKAVADAKKAVMDAAAVPGTEKAAFNTAIAAIEGTLGTRKTSIMAARKMADDEMMKANAALGKAMHAALGPPDAVASTVLANAAVTLSATGLVVDAVTGAGALATAAGDPASVTLMAGASAGAMGSWNGMDYMHTNTGTKVVNEARVYTNKGPVKTVPFVDNGNVLATASAGTAPNYTAIKDYLTVASAGSLDNGASYAKVMADDFTHPGMQDHALDSDTGIFTTRGTYDGAPGVYRCTGECSSTNDDGMGSPSALGGTWHFKPDAGASAMGRLADSTYLYYGWWVSKDKDDMPTAAIAFTGVFGDGTSIQGGTTDLATSPLALGGSATYVGHAAGKFAMSNPLDATGSGGHFTADATLTAKFGAAATADANNANGLSGTLDNFMANGESVPWTVSLLRANLTATGGTELFNDPDTTPVNEAATATVWAIDGNSAAPSGTWSGQMYDELPGNTDDTPAGDGSNVPTTVTGTFYSEFATIGRMVGAFGADKQ